MRFVTAIYQGREFIGVQQEKTIIDLQRAEEKQLGTTDIPQCMIRFIELYELLEEKIKSIMEVQDDGVNVERGVYAQEQVTIIAPIPRPRKNIFCVGKNYADHAIEMGSKDDIPSHIMLFSKAPTSVVGHEQVILHHKHITQELDYEGELAVIIGKEGTRIKQEDAMSYVFGYTIVNDVTARDLQAKHKQFLLGKSLDTSCPMGPVIVHKSIIKAPHHLHIETRVNGQVRQKGNTEQFIFSIEEIISVISQGMTLEPGDIIATGTPAGVGKGFNPPKFLKPGDAIEISIESIGTLRNTIER
ncbi:fumarylacetoacetate hydrolase family protein [Metabacillus iocasae]|uniref:2-keto-4-pentenoate hydratase/2-oxohepta-3-ene-1,7-dioic acid hydratase in catechol pathway n=1 Tax=Priestia iocasae TaxID=2291674 RepID=A0ABS2QV72_9BACI|nr:fumarylacetoacetate hydrolase family protein [Metabacillus iocasae]MBM7702631.1 2-keto-4-pentenoate hydratase/2-oxohepta-3-ene-1,7-dioic acid hydratase in catechol pathway [Metabacillus iocasae]